MPILPILLLVLVGVWIYLVWMVWKKKTNIFHDQMEPKLAEKRLKRLKKFLRVATISFAAFWVGFIVADILDGSSEIQVPDVFGNVVDVVLYILILVFVTGTIGGLVIFLKGRRKTT